MLYGTRSKRTEEDVARQMFLISAQFLIASAYRSKMCRVFAVREVHTYRYRLPSQGRAYTVDLSEEANVSFLIYWKQSSI